MCRGQYAHRYPTALFNRYIEPDISNSSIGDNRLAGNNRAVYHQLNLNLPRIPDPRTFNGPVGLLIVRGCLTVVGDQ